MKKLLILLLLASAAASAAPPRPEAKPYVRWWWLGSAVDREGVDHNLTEFARKGVGGMEITPIYGVRGNEARDIEYLSPAWMEIYRYTVERSRELGLQVDMSNCTGWPFGGPWVTQAESAQKYILETQPLRAGERLAGLLLPSEQKQCPVAQIEAVQAVAADGRRIDLTPRVDAQGRLDWQAPEGEWTLYTLFAGRTFQQVKRAAPGGEGLVLNHYDRRAVEHYLARFDKAFSESGAPWPDTFFNDSYEVYGASWDRGLPAQFERDHGYRLQDHLPEFAAEGKTERSARIVRDYRTTLSGMLLRNFTLPWREWAHARGVRIRNQAHGSPGNIFDFYAAVDIPECESFGRTPFDIPGLRSDADAKTSDADPAVLKFASSAAHVTGKRLTSCETLTWLTEHFRTSLAQCKPEIDQILCSGVNHVYFHGAPYSPRRAAFPGCLFYASINLSPTAPLWRDAEAMLGYVARCQEFLQAMTPDNDFLLYIPMEDISHNVQGKNYLIFDIHKMDRTMPALKAVMNGIVRTGYDADYISDSYVKSLRVEGSQLLSQGGARYKALLLPACRLIPPATLRHALDLAREGATVVFADRYPDDAPGFGGLETHRRELRKLTRQLPAADFATTAAHRFGKGRILTGSNLAELLSRAGGVYEPLKQAGCQLVRGNTPGGKGYFVSLLNGPAIDGWRTIGAQASQVVITDPLTGRSGIAASRPTNNGTEVYLQLQPGQSLLLTASEQTSPKQPRWNYRGETGTAIELRNWTLDFPHSEPAITERFTLDAPQSWTTLSPALATLCGTGRYTATVRIDDMAQGDAWLLDLGNVHESARVRINSREAGIAWSVPFTLEVGEFLQRGDNTIEIEVTNLPANLIADYDRRGVEWRIFKDANIVSALNCPLDTSSWRTEPSGLGSAVKLYPVKSKLNP